MTTVKLVSLSNPIKLAMLLVQYVQTLYYIKNT